MHPGVNCYFSCHHTGRRKQLWTCLSTRLGRSGGRPSRQGSQPLLLLGCSSTLTRYAVGAVGDLTHRQDNRQKGITSRLPCRGPTVGRRGVAINQRKRASQQTVQRSSQPVMGFHLWSMTKPIKPAIPTNTLGSSCGSIFCFVFLGYTCPFVGSCVCR